MAFRGSMPSSHLWVPSAEALSNITVGAWIVARSSSRARSALPRSVISSKEVAWRWWIHFITWWARNFFSPSSSSKNRSSDARSKSKTLVRPVVFDCVAMASPARSIIGSACVDVGGREEIRDLDRGILLRVRTVHGVGVDRVGEIGADGAGRRFLRIGGAHQFAVLQHRALAFQHLDHHRAGNHELDQRGEERTLAMHGIETFGFLLREMLHLRGNDLQAGLFETRIDFADDVLCNGIGLDDRQGALQRHLDTLRKRRVAKTPRHRQGPAPEDNRKTRVGTRV